MFNVLVCQADRPGSSPASSVCVRKMEFYQYVIDFSPPVATSSPKVLYVLSFLCDNACKRSLAICRKNSVLNRDINIIQTNKRNV